MPRSAFSQLNRAILRAIGLSSAAGLALFGGACGGKVVLEQSGGEGGAGGDTTTTSVNGSVASSSSGTQPVYQCDVDPPDGYVVKYGCIKSDTPPGCPKIDGMDGKSVFGELSLELNVSDCDGSGCCTEDYVVSVVCGPDPTVQEAC